jgi:putative transposase
MCCPRLVSARGAPAFLRSDNGPEFVSKALLSWIIAQGIGTALIEPGKESFNGKFRDECLSLEWFRSRAEAKVVIEAWRRHYNDVRPHLSLGYLTPNEFARQPNTAPRQATGQGAAVSGPPHPGPLHHPLRKEHMQEARDARLKLTVVRRNEAGQPGPAMTSTVSTPWPPRILTLGSPTVLNDRRSDTHLSSGHFWAKKHFEDGGNVI